MKPWEGKHWNSCQEKLHLEIENWKHTSNFRNGVIYTLNILEDALQKDWEEKQLKPVIYHEEWGGCLRAVIDGKPQNIANHLNKKYMKDKCVQTAESPKSSNWIPVEEKIPQDFEDVLATDGIEVHEAHVFIDCEGVSSWYHGELKEMHKTLKLINEHIKETNHD